MANDVNSLRRLLSTIKLAAHVGTSKDEALAALGGVRRILENGFDLDKMLEANTKEATIEVGAAAQQQLKNLREEHAKELDRQLSAVRDEYVEKHVKEINIVREQYAQQQTQYERELAQLRESKTSTDIGKDLGPENISEICNKYEKRLDVLRGWIFGFSVVASLLLAYIIVATIYYKNPPPTDAAASSSAMEPIVDSDVGLRNLGKANAANPRMKQALREVNECTKNKEKHKEMAACANDVYERAFLDVGYRWMDLIHELHSTRMNLATQLDAGGISLELFRAKVQEKFAELTTEEVRRRDAGISRFVREAPAQPAPASDSPFNPDTYKPRTDAVSICPPTYRMTRDGCQK